MSSLLSLISDVLVIYNFASDWPRTFFTARLFCLALYYNHICHYTYCVCTYTYHLYTTDPASPNITVPTPLSSTSFTVSWTITDNYIIIAWTNLRTCMLEGNMIVPENTNSSNVTGLNGIDNYIVSVTANNSCGMMMSDPITVYGKNVHY